ncbi:enoyl-CoA hydratase [Mycobacterium intermedium]|uniref:Enoyl-CoA hydratase n=1 Tax=Mycobacterium intermedium TaxID=28445 RepID=A0A1E3SDG6_MYCIE|nr:enoyl-CoA hydratase-related protein [Mycobacterium intermedium]MCV6966850.1 enoyl-CoA hydratase/isomerase family protein [Mycobacterium intermedium]ODQ99702.1 enoyl-CoA hydratase [Mycobacterium intermedium]OPE48584.1 enoyl-CoA hydratase [Mycobacterium intermedium]ORB07210.1 enoyl-CoA hydratase [Mycobacterium intermedium]
MSVELMPQAKVSAVKHLYQALASGDRAAIDHLLHPQFVGYAAEGLPLDMGGTHVGPDAMRDNLWWRIGKHFKVRVEPAEFRHLDDGRLLVVGTYRGWVRRNRNLLEAAFVHLIGFEADGRIVSLRQLTDTAAWCAALDEPGRLQTIDYQVENGLATICLNRPDERNAINLQLAKETLEVARRIAADRSVRAVLIWGNGPALTVGGDINYLLDHKDRKDQGLGDLLIAMTTPFHQAFELLSRIDAPIVTAAHGAVAGGGLGYVYAADIVLAEPNTKFVTAFSGLGLSGDGGGTWHLPRLIGPRRAASAYLRNTPISAEEALQWGLINEIVPADELHSRAMEVATDLANGPAVAFATQRALLRDCWRNDLVTSLTAETQGLKRTGDSADAAEAVAAFVAKRAPTYRGR